MTRLRCIREANSIYYRLCSSAVRPKTRSYFDGPSHPVCCTPPWQMSIARPTSPLFLTTTSSECKAGGCKVVGSPREASEAPRTFSLGCLWWGSLVSKLRFRNVMSCKPLGPSGRPSLRVVRHLHALGCNKVTQS